MNRVAAKVIRSFLYNKEFHSEHSGDEIIETALRNGLLGVLYRVWTPTSISLRKKLETIYNNFVARDTIQRKVISDVFVTFNKKKISYLLLKGWSLSDIIYPPLTRFAEDVDILVREEDFNRAKEIMLSKGFEQYKSINGFQFTPLFKEEILRHSEHPVEVDIHRDLFSTARFESDLNGVFKRSISFRFEDIEIRKMAPEDEIWYLTLHISAHFYRPKAINFLDMALHMKHYKIDMIKIAERFLRERNTEGAYFTLYLGRKYKIIEVEKDVMQKLRVSPFVKHITSALIEHQSLISFFSDFFYKSLIVWNTTSGINRRFRFILNYIRRRLDAYLKKAKKRWL